MFYVYLVVNNYMGQISLPRLEKINTSMTWESELLFQHERWAAPKLFILHRYLTQNMLERNFLKKKKIWVKRKYKYFASKYTIKKIKLFKVYPKKISEGQKLDVIGRYIYHWNNVYYTLILYSNFVRKD